MNFKDKLFENISYFKNTQKEDNQGLELPCMKLPYWTLMPDRYKVKSSMVLIDLDSYNYKSQPNK